MIKKIVFLVLLGVVLVGVAGLTTAHYQDHQNKETQKTAAAQSAQEAQAKELASAKAERAKLVEQYNGLRVECEKGAASYDKLPANLQKVVPQPKCGAVLL